MQNNKIIADIIKKLSKEKGVSIKQTLEECNINRNFIYDIEKKQSDPSSNTLLTIANYFNVSIDYLLGKTEQKEKPTTNTGDERSIKLNELIKDMSPDELAEVLDIVQYVADKRKGKQ